MTSLERCVICYEECKDLKLYSKFFNCKCKVHFHAKCWDEYIYQRNNNCPFCKNPVRGVHWDEAKAIFAFLIWVIFVMTILGVLEYKIVPRHKKIFSELIQNSLDYFL